MDAAVLVDESRGALENRAVAMRAVKEAAKGLSPGVRLALVFYSPDIEGGGVRMATDFTDDPGELLAAAESASAPESAVAGGGSAQRTALSRLLSPSFLSWRPQTLADAAVVHFTGARPCGDAPDWISLGRALGDARVRVHCFLFKGDQFARAAPWHAAMASLTGAEGAAVAGADARGLSAIVRAVLDGAEPPPCARVRLSAGASDRLTETPDEANAGSLLDDPSGVRVDGPDAYARVALSPSYRGLVRSDADSTRCPSSGPDAHERALRAGHRRLARAVREALDEIEDEEEGGGVCDVVSSSTYREMCEEFCDRASAFPARPPLRDLFESVSGIAAGPAVCAPYTSRAGRYNYQAAFTLRVRAVRAGYCISYASFLRYWESSGRSAPDGREDLRRGVNDLILRDLGDITGIAPCIPEDSSLARAVYGALARTPWLDAVAWHSACRHAFPPPRACVGLLSAAAWSACSADSVPDETVRMLLESAAAASRSRPVRPLAGAEVAKHAAGIATGGRDWGGLVRAAARERCSRIRGERGPGAISALVHGGRVHPPLWHSVASSDVARACGRLAAAAGAAPPPGLAEEASRATIAEICGHPTYGDALSALRRPSPASRPARRRKDGAGRGDALPETGTRRFNRALAGAAARARAARGLPSTGSPGEKMSVLAEDLQPGDETPGARLIRERGNACYAFVDGMWMPVRLGGAVRVLEVRGGRRVYTWPPSSSYRTSSLPASPAASSSSPPSPGHWTPTALYR